VQLIDWITVVAQIVNFLILVGLLKYFLYGRVLSAMQKREQDIATQWEEAERDRSLAADELVAASNKNRELDEQRDQLLAVVRDEVDEFRQELTSKVRAEVEQQHSRWSEAVREESEAFLRDLGKRASLEVCAIARRALADLAGTELEVCIVNSFLERIENLDDEARTRVIASLREGKNKAVVQTSFEMSQEMMRRVIDDLHQHFGQDADIRFEQSSDLICGIALHTGAHKLAWELRDYLSDLEQELQQALDEETTTKRSPRTEAGAT
jgi:F-type H+-transporting ATPase subunit b